MAFIKTKYLILVIFSALALMTAVLISFELIDRRAGRDEVRTNRKDFDKSKDKSSFKRSTLVLEGIEARNKANYKKALELHFEAHELAQKDNDTIAQVIALNNIATDLRRVALNTEASKYYYQALELATDDVKYDKLKSFVYNGLGNVFLSLKKNNIARQYFQKSLIISENQNNNLGQAINLANLAETFNRQDGLDSILYYYNKSLEFNKKINSNIGTSICKKALADLSLSMGDTLKALSLSREAFETIKNSNDLFHKFEIEKGLCDVLIKTNRLEESELATKDLLEIANKIGASENKYEAYQLIARLKEKQNDFKQAFYANKLASNYHDSLLIENSEINILEFEKQLKIDQAVSRAKFLTSKAEFIERTKNQQRNVFTVLFFAFLCFITLLYMSVLNKKKTGRELQKINEMKSCFFGNISHEFRTPLTLIKAPLEKWLSEDLDPNLKNDLAIINRNSTRLLYLVEQLLNISKVDAGSFKISYKISDLSVQLRGLAQEYKHFVTEKQLDYKIEIEDSGLVKYDSNSMEIIVMNLLSNAFKFTPTGECITVTGIKGEGFYRIAVANSGNYLNASELENVFDRFYTSSISSNAGSGIGLALAKELSTLHKAELKVEKSRINEIEFSVNFPITADEEGGAVEKQHFHQLQHNNAKSVNNGISKPSVLNGCVGEPSDELCNENPLLLIVEDNEDMRNYISHSFDGVFDVIVAANGQEGLKLARKHIPDIIISDIMMQFMDGIELCNAIKEDALTNHIPVILLTALAEEEVILRGLANRADDYVTKPFSIKVLRSKALNLIELRKLLGEKYREEMIIAPLNTLIKNERTSFNQSLEELFTTDIVNPKFGVKQFCEKTSMSRSQLYRKIKAISGMSVSEFIRIHRLKIASELLKDGEISISDVCYASGFNNASYFSKSFKESFGITPVEYQKEQQKPVESS